MVRKRPWGATSRSYTGWGMSDRVGPATSAVPRKRPTTVSDRMSRWAKQRLMRRVNFEQEPGLSTKVQQKAGGVARDQAIESAQGALEGRCQARGPLTRPAYDPS